MKQERLEEIVNQVMGHAPEDVKSLGKDIAIIVRYEAQEEFNKLLLKATGELSKYDLLLKEWSEITDSLLNIYPNILETQKIGDKCQNTKC